MGLDLKDFDFNLLKSYALVCLIYLLIAVVLFLPEIGNLKTTVLGNSGDVYQNLWNLWWAKYSLLQAHVSIYEYTYLLFWPTGFNLVFETLTPIAGVISIPFQSVSLEFGYNFLFFLGFVVSGVGAYVLINYLLKNRSAAFLGGLFFDFGSFHIANSFNHIDFFFIGWIPIFLYFFLQTLDNDRNKYLFAVGAGISFVLIVFMDEFEEGLMTLFVALAIILFYLVSKERRLKVVNRQFMLSAVIIAITAFICGSWGFIPLIYTALSPGGLSAAYSLNDLSNNVAWSANLVSFFVPNYYFYNDAFQTGPMNLLFGSNDRTVYIGYTLIILSIYGIYKTRKKYAFWAAIFLLFFLLSLGPFVKIEDAVTQTPGLYLIYHLIPYINFIREPARFYLIASLAISVLAAVGVKGLIEQLEAAEKWKRYVYVLVIAISVIFILETFGIPTTQQQGITTTPYIPDELHKLSNLTNLNYSFLVLPSPGIPNYIYSGIADYYVTVLQKPMVGGYISRQTDADELTLASLPLIADATYLATYDNQSYFTPYYSSPIYENYTLQSLKTMRDYKTSFIIIENNAYQPGELEDLNGFMKYYFGSPIYTDNNVTIYFTAPVLETSFYKSDFISYYDPFEWTYIFLNSSFTGLNFNITGWAPSGTYGSITTYAPYPSNSPEINYTYINTNMSFIATAFRNESLVLQVYPGLSNTSTNGAGFNVTNIRVPIYEGSYQYSINMSLISGSVGNRVIFIYQNNSNMLDNEILVDNITFNYSK